MNLYQQHPQPHSLPHDMSRVPNSGPYPNEGPYRPNSGAPPPPGPPGHQGPPAPPQYPTHHISQTPQSHSPTTYGAPAGYPPAASRGPLPDRVPTLEVFAHRPEGFSVLAPGQQPVAPEPPSMSREENGRRYELIVVQQPQRARMCGFGDKDRRPITPPPCVQVVITDVKTGRVIDVNDIEHSMFVLHVDLWSADGTRELNMVRHSQTVPLPLNPPEATSGPSPAAPFERENGQSYNQFPGQPQANPYTGSSQPSYGQAPPPSQYQQQQQPPPPHSYSNGAHYPAQNGYSQPQPHLPPPASGFYSGAGIHAMGGSRQQYGPPPPPVPSQTQAYDTAQYPHDHQIITRTGPNSPPQGMFTRNIIGSLAVNAARLTDPDDRIGIWFVLQDMSVRTEGIFRLKFSFVNVGLPIVTPLQPPHNAPAGTNMVALAPVNTNKAPVLATAFSDPFQVYSAKRFPGVVESTQLSKCFATQGVKIPIRKDGPGKGDRLNDDDD